MPVHIKKRSPKSLALLAPFSGGYITRTFLMTALLFDRHQNNTHNSHITMTLYRFVHTNTSLQPVSSQQVDSVLSDQAPKTYESYGTEHNLSPSQYARLQLPNQVNLMKYSKIKNSSVMFSLQNNCRYQQDYKKFCNNSLHSNFSLFNSDDCKSF
jgi:hypothetical protein